MFRIKHKLLLDKIKKKEKKKGKYYEILFRQNLKLQILTKFENSPINGLGRNWKQYLILEATNSFQ